MKKKLVNNFKYVFYVKVYVRIKKIKLIGYNIKTVWPKQYSARRQTPYILTFDVTDMGMGTSSNTSTSNNIEVVS